MQAVKTLATVRQGDAKNTLILNIKTQGCPECGSTLIPDGGCFYCRSCGYSLCTL